MNRRGFFGFTLAGLAAALATPLMGRSKTITGRCEVYPVAILPKPCKHLAFSWTRETGAICEDCGKCLGMGAPAGASQVTFVFDQRRKQLRGRTIA